MQFCWICGVFDHAEKEESFDNWDQFIEELYSMGDIDRVVEIYNEAVDRYYAEKEAE